MIAEFIRLLLPLIKSKVVLFSAISLYSLGVGAKVHEFGPYLIEVKLARISILSKYDYSIAIAKDGLVLFRLTVASDSPRVSSYVTDMDENGLFELFVVIGTRKDGLHSFCWNGAELAHLNIPEKTASGVRVGALPGVYSVRENKLRKLLFNEGNRVADTSSPKQYSYSVKQGEWLETR